MHRDITTSRGTPMQGQKDKPKPKLTHRDRSNSVLIKFADLKDTLNQLARLEARESGEHINMSRTVRRLVHDEAARRGIIPKPRPGSIGPGSSPPHSRQLKGVV
jgi:hypothetical protein